MKTTHTIKTYKSSPSNKTMETETQTPFKQTRDDCRCFQNSSRSCTTYGTRGVAHVSTLGVSLIRRLGRSNSKTKGRVCYQDSLNISVVFCENRYSLTLNLFVNDARKISRRKDFNLKL